MRKKKLSQSNAETEGGENEQELTVNTLEQTATIVDVWNHNFKEQLNLICSLVQNYNVIAMDTEFPGNFVKKHSLTPYYNTKEIDYQCVWHNVEQTKLIQIGFSLANINGDLPSKITSWQFHLHFDLIRENVEHESIEMLQTAGINFDRLKKDGIPQRRFAETIMSSGLILNKNIKWIVFHGSYDFGYLLRELRGESLPKNSEDFYKSVHIYFPNIYDLKHVISDDEELKLMGLSALAKRIGVLHKFIQCARVGPNHQAGSDSLLTLRSYFQLRKLFGDLHFEDKANSIYGIGQQEKPQYLSSQHQGYQSVPYFGPLYQYLQYSGSYPSEYHPYYHFGSH